MRALFAVFFLLSNSLLASPWVVLSTTLGEVYLELNEAQAPMTTNNFLRYAQSGFYTGTVFHRVIPGFIVQGGGYDETLHAKPARGPIANESYNGLKNVKGAIAMARSNDPHSAQSQFFINLGDNPGLDYDLKAKRRGYAVFGKVVRGMNIIQRIGRLSTTTAKNGLAYVPKTLVRITQVRVLEQNPLISKRRKKYDSLSHQPRHPRHRTRRAKRSD